jgi:two-component system chemotaxis response regulator CheB
VRSAVTRVLVVDDSALVRRVLTEELSRFPDIEVVGAASDPYVARERIAELRPDVLTLDIEMPRMDGLTFLEKLMTHFPLPVVVVSSVAPKHSETALRALQLGAVEVVPKPGSSTSVPDVSRLLVHAVRAAGMARVRRLRPLPPPAPGGAATRASPPGGGPGPAHRPASHPPGSPGGGAAVGGAGLTAAAPLAPRIDPRIIALGASTGGTRALEAVLVTLPPTVPGVVIVQHMPPGFTRAFAERMDRVCALEVREAVDGDRVGPGVALVAPGDRHMTVHGTRGRYLVRLDSGPPVHHQRPAVDRLFDTVADRVGADALGAILTGMGADGADGLVRMRQSGAVTLAQDEESCVVFGMPREAIRRGGAGRVLPLDAIGPAITAWAAGHRATEGEAPSERPVSAAS